MKKNLLFFFVILCRFSAPLNAQSQPTDAEMAVVYSLPKTVFCVEVQVEKQIQKPGQFYRYSERFLATNKVITEEKTNYFLKNISVTTLSQPDANRTFTINPSDVPLASRISVNKKGILSGFNTGITEKTVTKTTEKPSFNSQGSTPALLPLGEEFMMAGSEAKLAEGAAKQIYRIRESRLSLLTADVEKMPADGVSVKAMLEGMDANEKALTELFIGKRTSETIVQKILIEPNANVSKEVIFRLSALKGIVASDDLSGTPYYLSISSTLIPTHNFTEQKSKNKEKVGLYTLIPSTAKVTIEDGVNTFFNEQFFVPQFGTLVTIPESLLKQPNVKIRIDSQTGRLLSIE